jgi:O-methyltransferase
VLNDQLSVRRNYEALHSDDPANQNLISKADGALSVTGTGPPAMSETPEPPMRRSLKSWLANHIPGVRCSALWAVSRSALLAASIKDFRSTPVERCPTFWAYLLGIQVPRSVRRQPAKTPTGGPNINIIIELLRQTADVSGDVAECGVYRGSSLLAIGLFVKQHGLRKTVLGFDSFEGFGESIAFDIQIGGQTTGVTRVGGFKETSYELVLELIKRLGLEHVVQLRKGFFSDTLPAYSRSILSFVHLDCDIYHSYKECLDFFYPRLSSGGIILFDEYNDPSWPGCNLAVDQFLADKPERPIEIESGNYQKWYIIKS